MIRQFTLIGMILLFACQPRKKDACQQFQVVPIPNKLETLLSLPQDTVLDYFDLSDDLLMEQPDLSGYTIRSLNLSNNGLYILDPSLLPQGLEKLDLSYNAFREFIHDSINRVNDLNLSHNLLILFALRFFVDRLDVSYNKDLFWLRLFWTYDSFTDFHKYRSPEERGQMSYLNMSHNPSLEHTVAFEPSKVDTIIRNDIADDKKLVEIKKYMNWEINHLKGIW